MNRTVTKLSVLGSTGSIGRNTLEVVRQFPERFQVVGLAAGCNVDLLKQQIDRFRPAVAAVRDEAAADMLARLFGGSKHRPEIVWGSEGYRQVAAL
ncbi:MAG: 1-deoxy-D-xylulose-5-phosphate reductoisomerase, partial [Thermodesulfobacteriota bacterium]|nr:1-deoxy-D-xylulose-5-phosphate reductoisomerase [Thermodesulfobacteriota bacterium]